MKKETKVVYVLTKKIISDIAKDMVSRYFSADPQSLRKDIREAIIEAIEKAISIQDGEL